MGNARSSPYIYALENGHPRRDVRGNRGQIRKRWSARPVRPSGILGHPVRPFRLPHRRKDLWPHRLAIRALDMVWDVRGERRAHWRLSCLARCPRWRDGVVSPGPVCQRQSVDDCCPEEPSHFGATPPLFWICRHVPAPYNTTLLAEPPAEVWRAFLPIPRCARLSWMYPTLFSQPSRRLDVDVLHHQGMVGQPLASARVSSCHVHAVVLVVSLHG